MVEWLLVTTGVVLFLVATAATWFDTNGPWRPIYALHDNVWLPFQGVTWTAIFPYGVIWLLIAAGLLTLLLSEYLGWLPFCARRRCGLSR